MSYAICFDAKKTTKIMDSSKNNQTFFLGNNIYWVEFMPESEHL